MSAQNSLVEGYSGLSALGLSPALEAALLQAIRRAYGVPVSSGITGVGFTLVGATPPDVANNAWMARCLWLDTSEADPDDWVLNKYNATTPAWETLSAGPILPDNISNGSITTAKFSLSGLVPYGIIRGNAAGNAWVISTIGATLQSNEVTLAKISPTGLADWLNTNLGGGDLDIDTINGADLPTWFADNMPAGNIAISKLADGTARYVLRTNATSTGVEYVAPTSVFDQFELPIDKINYTTQTLTYSGTTLTVDGTTGCSFYVQLTANVSAFTVSNLRNGQTITVDISQDGTGGRTLAWAGSITWVGIAAAPTVASAANAKTIVRFTRVNGVTFGEHLNKAATAFQTTTPFALDIVTAGDWENVAHGLGAVPTSYSWEFICTVDNAGYVAGERIKPTNVYAAVSGQPVYNQKAGPTNVSLGRTAGLSPLIADGTTGANGATFTPASWTAICVYSA
jgi:hypothetical protein